MKKLKDISRADLIPKNAADGDYTNEQVQTSALMRIADATELISKNYLELIHELERVKARSDRNLDLLRESKAENERLKLSIKGYKSHITRLKNKVKQFEEDKS